MKKLRSFTKASLCVNYWLSDADLAALLSLADNVDALLALGGGGNPAAVEYTNTEGTKSLDLSAGRYFYSAARQEGNYTFTFTNPPAAGELFEFYIEVIPNTFYVIEFPSGGLSGALYWPGGSVPSMVDATPFPRHTIIHLSTIDGGAIYHATLHSNGSSLPI